MSKVINNNDEITNYHFFLYFFYKIYNFVKVVLIFVAYMLIMMPFAF